MLKRVSYDIGDHELMKSMLVSPECTLQKLTTMFLGLRGFFAAFQSFIETLMNIQ